MHTFQKLLLGRLKGFFLLLVFVCFLHGLALAQVGCEWRSERIAGTLGGQAVNPDDSSRVAPKVTGLQPGQKVVIEFWEEDSWSPDDDLRISRVVTADDKGNVDPGSLGNDYSLPPQDLGDPGGYSEPYFVVKDAETGKKLCEEGIINVPHNIILEENTVWQEVDKTKWNLGGVLSGREGGIGGKVEIQTSGECTYIRKGKSKSGIKDPVVTQELLLASDLPQGWFIDVTPKSFTLEPGDSLEDSIVVCAPTVGMVLFQVRTIAEYPDGTKSATVTDTLAIEAVRCVPSLSPWGYIVLISVLLALGTWVFFWRKKVVGNRI